MLVPVRRAAVEVLRRVVFELVPREALVLVRREDVLRDAPPQRGDRDLPVVLFFELVVLRD